MPTYAIILDALWIIFVVYWIATAFGNKKTAYRWHPWRRAVVVLLFVTGSYYFWHSDFAQRQLFVATEALNWAGVAVCALGVGVAIWARRTLGTNWSGNPTIKEGHELIEKGPYGWVRHPIYTGILLGLAGTFLANGHARELIILVLATIGFIFKLRIEEGLMVGQFPEAYPAYRKRTKALLPYVW